MGVQVLQPKCKLLKILDQHYPLGSTLLKCLIGTSKEGREGYFLLL